MELKNATRTYQALGSTTFYAMLQAMRRGEVRASAATKAAYEEVARRQRIGNYY